MRILIASCGTRNQLTRFFKEEPLTEWVVGVDCSPYAPALYEADAFYIVPRMTDPGYLTEILEICKKERIDTLLPLQEDELMLMAENRTLFETQGITVVVSAADTIELCRDKYLFYRYLKERKLPCLKTWESLQEFEKDYEEQRAAFPVFVKPKRGCGSIGISRVDTLDLLRLLCRYSEEQLMIQQFCTGQEFGADIYVDLLDGGVKAVFVKEKLRMRAGETEKSVSYKDEELFGLILRTVEGLSLKGPVDMDIFRMDGAYYISEINPRFGGGYPHAYGCGVNFPKLLATNVQGEVNPPGIGNYEEKIYMMKYQDALIRKI